MCGLAAILDSRSENVLPDSAAIRILDSLQHRGPDGNGWKYFKSESAHVSLFHTRLAIIDPLPRSDQPLGDLSGNQIIFNGEIYNYRKLATQFAPSEPLHSDTQVLLALYRKYGSGMVQHLRGMYAFVIWDPANQLAFAARDSFGIKPLYIAQYGSCTVFASEVSAILATGQIPCELSQAGVSEYFRWGSCQGHSLPLQHIRRLEPGESLQWKNGNLTSGPKCSPFSEQSGTRADDGSMMRTAFTDSVESHLVSDVPVAAFLSSGIDSVATIAAANLSGAAPLPSFTLSFPGKDLDESTQAAEFAARFNSPHTAIELSEQQLTTAFNDFLASQDLPGVDGFNTYCISQAVAEQGYKVVLSGLGGDELLGGYPSFQQVPQLLRLHRQLQWLQPLLSGHHLTELSASLRKLSRVLEFMNSSGSASQAYETSRCLFSLHEINQLQKSFGFQIHSLNRNEGSAFTELTLPEQVSVLEARNYLNHQLLRDTDNYSMTHGLEIRVPFLDVPLWETVSMIDPKFRFEARKFLLQRAFPELPDILFEQKKRGFGLPWDEWIHRLLKENFIAARSLPLKYSPTWFQTLSMISFTEWCRRHRIEIPQDS